MAEQEAACVRQSPGQQEQQPSGVQALVGAVRLGATQRGRQPWSQAQVGDDRRGAARQGRQPWSSAMVDREGVEGLLCFCPAALPRSMWHEVMRAQSP